jgi:hypothetical protein
MEIIKSEVKFKFNFYNFIILNKLNFEKMAGLDSRKDYFSIVINILNN